MTHEIPLNAGQLARQMNKSRFYVAAMKAAGYVFTHGPETLLSHALEWRKTHPDFRTTFYRTEGARMRQRHLQAATVGMSGELAHSNG